MTALLLSCPWQVMHGELPDHEAALPMRSCQIQAHCVSALVYWLVLQCSCLCGALLKRRPLLQPPHAEHLVCSLSRHYSVHADATRLGSQLRVKD